MKISSEEIRVRAIKAYKDGLGSQEQIAVMYDVSPRTIRRWWQEFITKNKTAPSPRGHNPRSLNEQNMKELDRLLTKQPDMTLEQLRLALGKTCSVVTIHNSAKRLNWRYKKNSTRQRTKQG